MCCPENEKQAEKEASQEKTGSVRRGGGGRRRSCGSTEHQEEEEGMGSKYCPLEAQCPFIDEKETWKGSSEYCDYPRS
jgi:hypothetical protein